MCVRFGGTYPKNLPYYAYALHDYQLSTCNVLNSKQFDVFIILDIKQKQQHLHWFLAFKLNVLLDFASGLQTAICHSQRRTLTQQVDSAIVSSAVAAFQIDT